VLSAFRKFRWNSFLIWAASGRWCPIVRTVALPLQVISIPRLRASGPRRWSSERLIWCTQFPYLMLSHPDQEDWRPNVWILNAILALWMSASRWESTSSGRLQRTSHNYVLERNPEACWTLRVIQTCCWNVRTDASWSNLKLLDTEEGPDGKFSSSGRMMLWIVGRPGRYVTSSGLLAGNQIF
jgi:hypothetical protein